MSVEAPPSLAWERSTRDQQRLVARLERDVRECLGRRNDGRAMTADAVLPQRCGERLAERTTGGANLFLGVSGRDLEREVERRVGGEQHEQMVEHGDAGRDVRGPGAVREPGAAHSSVRSIDAPSARSRSSIRS